jgi:alpha-L-fucosidase 2
MNSRFLFIIATVALLNSSCQTHLESNELAPPQFANLKFSTLASSWDEAIPLGNGMLGALVWQKGDNLRISLDRADLWDLRPMANIDRPEWSYEWVKNQLDSNSYQKVHELFDIPYDRDAAPSKIPGAALEFNIVPLGRVKSVELWLNSAICQVKWEDGAEMETFINAGNNVGWFRIKGNSVGIKPKLITPPYHSDKDTGDENPVTGQYLRRLGYPAGKLDSTSNSITYTQEGWGGFKYQVTVRWRVADNFTVGCWSISSEFPGIKSKTSSEKITDEALTRGFSDEFYTHQVWWGNYWSQSAVTIPDTLLCKQWYLEMYKLGSATGNGAPPISLQAVWTADNGKLPPWKGDFHHDLNTQLSYWPAYSSNHLEQEKGYIDWLQKNKPAFEKYTQSYFKVEGLNVPGVTTLNGKPMGGWIQYSFGPSVAAWLGQHFYLHWKYTMDKDFLEKKAYPWVSSVASFFENISVKDSLGKRKFPISSSPEVNDNSEKAWFRQMTNYDLSLVRWTFEKSSEMAEALGNHDEAAEWDEMLSEWPELDVDSLTGLTYAPGVKYETSHRHFSHLMAIHPLSTIDWANGPADQDVIKKSIATLDKVGPDWWCGYSWSWLGNLKARAHDGEGAAEALRIFASDFCLKNSFHVNGDQSHSGKSKMTYRPFTLEGNFAFAAGVQELLLQSQNDTIRVFPALPPEWKDASFEKLRAEGAFLVSAMMKDGEVTEVKVFSEKGGELRIENPFGAARFRCMSAYRNAGRVLLFDTKAGQTVVLRNTKWESLLNFEGKSETKK